MEKEYDFAFSFAGEDRSLVLEIKNGLNGYKVFYDEECQSELCGKDLYHYLRTLYSKRCKYVVCFISKYYKQKMWTNLEFTAIKERLMETFFASDFLIPIVLDQDCYLDDIPSFFGFHEHKSVSETITFLKNKYTQSLNEDFYLDNINQFSHFLLEKTKLRLSQKGIQAENSETYLKYKLDLDEKEVYLLPDFYSNLPCILLYEEDPANPPSVIITWKRKNDIRFTWTGFTSLSGNGYDNISIDDLIDKFEEYLISYER